MKATTQRIRPLTLPLSSGCQMTLADFGQQLDLKKIIRPETDFERQLLELPEFREGLNWGKPRFGHPEGKVGLHVREVLDNIEKLYLKPAIRTKLRTLALVHDTFKFQEVKTMARGKRVHHGKIAREFMSKYTDDAALLDILELHDESFYIWRMLELKNDVHGAMPRLKKLLESLGESLPAYFLFFKCDTETGDKILAPLRWFTAIVEELASEEAKMYIRSCL